MGRKCFQWSGQGAGLRETWIPSLVLGVGKALIAGNLTHTQEPVSLCPSLLAEAQNAAPRGRLITLPDLAGVVRRWVIDA